MNSNNIDWKKYLIVLLITTGLFFTASYLSNYFGNQKINQLKTIQDNIAINILSSETQYALLQESSCKNISGSVLSGELDELGKKLEWSQNNLGSKDEISYLKKYYALLQIKDYLLMKKISKSCGIKSAFILYFYTTAENCTLCEQEGLVLSSLRDKYSELRVYSFDYSTDSSAVVSMLKIYKIKDTALPALVINDNLMTGFHPIDELEKIIQDVFKLQETKPTTEGNNTSSK